MAQHLTVLHNQSLATHLAAATDRGRVRPENQDYVDLRFFSERPFNGRKTGLHSGSQDETTRRTFDFAMLVADGVGGGRHGAVASATVGEDMMKALEAAVIDRRLIDDGRDTTVQDTLHEIPLRIHRHLMSMAGERPELEGMGTTLTTACVAWPWLYVVHIGDSRAYLYRNGKLMPLTTDHTVGQALMDRGEPGFQTDQKSPFDNVLWNALSATECSPVPEINRFRLQPEDGILLCSDGLTRHLSAGEISAVLQQGRPVNETCQRLIDDANADGGRDNISVAYGRFCSQLSESCDETILDPDNICGVSDTDLEATAIV